jgi:hypothetical protein
MISLGGISLSDDMELVNLYQQAVVTGSGRRTLGGRFVRYSTKLTAGLALDLVAKPDAGWITLATLEQIIALQDVNEQHALIYESTTYLVGFRYDDPPAVDFLPLIPRPNQAATDWMYGTIKLVTLT